MAKKRDFRSKFETSGKILPSGRKIFENTPLLEILVIPVAWIYASLVMTKPHQILWSESLTFNKSLIIKTISKHIFCHGRRFYFLRYSRLLVFQRAIQCLKGLIMNYTQRWARVFDPRGVRGCFDSWSSIFS